MSTESSRAAAYTSHSHDADLDIDPVPEMLARSLATFRKDLPDLLKAHYHKWVAYHGEERVGFARTETELYEICLRRGLARDEFLVCSIEPEIPDEEITWSNGS